MAIREGTALGALLFVSSAVGARAADRPWVEVRSPRFIVVSQSGEGAARDLAWQFEQVHAVFSKAYPWAKLQSGRPFTVIAVRNESAVRELSPAFWAEWKTRPTAVFVSGRGQDFVAIRTDIVGADREGENPYSTAYQGYVSIVLHASFPGGLPLWFDRGLQAFFGNTVVREKDVHVGRLIESNLEMLNRGSRYSLAELVAVDRNSPQFRKQAGRQVFEAQAWLLVHYLFFGDEGAHRPTLNRYADLLRAGRSPADSFRDAFGDGTAVENGLGLYLSRRLYRYTQINLDVNVDRASFAMRPVGPPEAMAIRAAFLHAMGEPAPAARTLAESALQSDPKQPVAHEVLGLVADSEGRTDDARAAFGRAVENGSQSYWAHYRLAQLLWKTDADRPTLERIASVLEKASQMNPDDPWSFAFLADTRVDLETAAAGLEPARTAVKLAPGEARHRQTLARVLGEMGRIDEAQQEAGRALALSRDDKSRGDSRELMTWLARLRDRSTAPVARATASADEAALDPSAAAAGSPSAPPKDAPRRTARSGRPLRHPCESGDPEGCRAWLDAAEAACANGSIEACTSGGSAYTGAPGVTPDPARATRMLEKACIGGSQDGCVNLAVNLVNNGRPEDRRRALDLLAKACAGGHQPACGLRTQIDSSRR